MGRPIAWFWGLFPLALLAFLAVFLSQNAVERVLTRKAQMVLQAEAKGWGTISLSGRDAILSGEAPDLAAASNALLQVGSLNGIRKIADQTTIKPPRIPYAFGAMRGERTLTLTGTVPDSATKTALLALTASAFEGERVEDQLVIRADEAPNGFAAALSLVLPDLARLSPGASLEITDQAVTLRGQAAYAQAKDQISAQFRRIEGFSGTLDLAIATLDPVLSDVAACQALYKDVLAEAVIRFRVGAADINPHSMPLLDRLARVTLRCETSKVEIGGHTDSDGSDASNLELSRRRAEAVAAFLVRAGAPASRIEPVGFGATMPLAPNDSAENKAKNRRIEFIVK
jgi:OmpA-OmpF porin, OOP family